MIERDFEKALFLDKIRDISPGDIDRLYFGNEFCENLIPAPAALKERYNFTKDKKKDFTFVTPFVTDAGLDKLGILFDFLNRQKDVEIVFNDWGVYHFLKNNFSNLKPVLGRLLSKQRRDPRILKIFLGKEQYLITNEKKQRIIMFSKKVPPALFRHYQSSLINVKVFQEFLLSQGINRVEMDNLIWKMNIRVPREMGVSIYFPYGYISTGRMCWKTSLSYAPCKKQCREYFFRLKDKSLPVPFYAVGNTIFYESGRIDFKGLRHLKKLRIVYQTSLSF